MADNRVQYIIDIIADDKKLRQQLSNINWEEIIGTKGNGFSDVLKSEAKESKEVIKSTLGGLHLDWSSILGEKDLKRLETAIAKVVSSNADKIKGFAKEGDVSGIKNIIAYVSALGDELKALGSSFDVPSLVRSMTSFMKLIMPLSTKFDELAKAPEKVSTSFGKKFSNTSGITQMTKSVNQSVTVYAKLDKVMTSLGKDTSATIKEARAYQDVLKSLTGKRYQLKISSLGADQLEDEFYRINESLIETEHNLDLLDKNSEQYKNKNIKRVQNYVKLLAINERYAKLTNGQYLINDDFIEVDQQLEDWKKKNKNATIQMIQERRRILEQESRKKATSVLASQVSQETDKLTQKLTDLQKQTDKISEGLAKAISEQLSNIQIQLSINDQEKQKIVDEINSFIDNLNSGTGYHVNKINLGAGAISTGFVQLEEKDIEAKLKEMREGTDKILKSLNKEINTKNTEGILTKVRDDLSSTQKHTYDEEKKYLESLTRQRDAYIKFQNEIVGEKSKSLTASEASDLYFFYKQMDNLEYKRDLILENTRKWRQEMVDLLSFKGQNLELDFDIEQITKDALFQEIQNYFEENPIKVHINAGTIDGATDGKNITINGSGGVNLDQSTLSAAFYDAIQALVTGDVSKLKPSDKPAEKAAEGSKTKAIYMDPEDNFTKYMVSAVDKLANAYADKDTVVAKQVKSFFANKGLNLEEIQGKPMEIINALSIMMEQYGNTLLSSLDNLISGLGGKNKTLSFFKEDLREMLRTYNIKSEDSNEAWIREESVKVFQDFLARTDFRSGVNKMARNINKPDKWKAPDVSDVNVLIAATNKMFANAESNLVSDADKERVKSLWSGLINGRTEGEGESAIKYYGLQDIMDLVGAAQTPEDKEVLRQAVENFREGARGVMQSLSAYIKTFDFTALINGVLHHVKANADGTVSGLRKAQRAIKGDESRIEDVWITSDPSKKPIGVTGRKQEAKLMATYGQKDSLIRQAPNTSDIKYRYIDVESFQPKVSEARKATQNELLGIEEDAKAATERREAANKNIVAEERKQIEDALKTDKEIENELKEAIKKRSAIRGRITKDKNKLDALGVTSDAAKQANVDLIAANKRLKEAQEQKTSAEQSIEMVSTTLVPNWEQKDRENKNELAKYRKWQNNPEKYARDFYKEYTKRNIESREGIIQSAQAEQKFLETRIDKLKKSIKYIRTTASRATQNGDGEALELALENEQIEWSKLDEAQRQSDSAKQREAKAVQEIRELREITARTTEEARNKWKASFEEYTKRQIDYYTEKTKENGEDPREKYKKASQKADKDIAKAQAEVDRISLSKEMRAYQLAQDSQQASNQEAELNARISGLEKTRERNKITHADILAKDQTREDIDNIEIRIGELEKKIELDEQERKELEDYVEKNYTKKPFNSGYTAAEEKAKGAYDAANLRATTLGQIIGDTSLTSTPVIGEFSEEIQKVINSLFESRAKLQALSAVGFEADKSDKDLKAIAQKRLNAYNNGAEKIIDDLLKDSTGQGEQTIEKLTQFLAQNKNVDVRDIIGLMNKKADKNVYNNGKFLVELSEVEKNINSFLNNNEDVARFLSNEQVSRDGRLSSLLKRTDKDKEMDTFVLDFAKNIIKQGQEFVKTHLKAIEDNISNQLTAIKNKANTEGKDLDALKAKANEAEETRTQRLRNYVATSLQSVKENNQKIKKLEDPKEIALLLKENEDLIRSIGEINSAYKKAHKGLDLLSKEQLEFYNNNSSSQYQGYVNANINKDKRDIELEQKALYEAMAKRVPLLTNRKATLLDEIRTATTDGKDTKELEVELSAINAELAKYEIYTKALANNNLADVFDHDREFAVQYINSLAKIVALENEVDLMRAKGASQTDVNAKLSEIDSNKLTQEQLTYVALKKRQQELLTDITNATKEGQSTTELQEKLKVVNRQLVDLELNARRVQDSKVGGIINDVDVRVLKEYNTQMQEFIKKEQELALAQAIGEGVDKAKTAVNQAKRRVTNKVAETKEDVAIVNAESSNRAQSLNYLATTDESLRLAKEQREAIQKEKQKAEEDLEKIQSDNYQTSRIYREHIDTVKSQMVQDYIHSDRYKADKEAGYRKVDEGIATYVNERLAALGIADTYSDWAARLSEIKYDYRQSNDYKQYKEVIEQNAISERAEEILSIKEATEIAIKKINDEFLKKMYNIRIMSDDDIVMKSEMDRIRGGLDFDQLQQNFANFFTREVLNSMNQGTRESMVKDLRVQLKAARKSDSGVSKEEIDKLQEKHDFYNTDNDKIFIDRIIEGLAREAKVSGGTDADVSQVKEFLRTLNPNKLSHIFDWFNQLEKAIGTEPMSEDAVRKEAEKNLIEQERAREQNEINALKLTQISKLKGINKEVEGKVNKELSDIVYEYAIKQLATEIQQSEGLDEGSALSYKQKLKELLDEHVYSLVSNYASNLHVEDMVINGNNIREMAEQTARNKLSELDKLEASNAEILTKIETNREAAIKYGNIGKGEVIDAEIIREQAIHFERLTTAKEQQLKLTEEITEAEAAEDTATAEALRKQLRDVDATVERLQMIVDNRDALISLVAEERRDEKVKNTWDPEKQKLWLLNAIETARTKLNSEDEAVKQKAQTDIDRYTQLLQKVEDKIAQQKPEPKGLIDQILDKVVSRLGGRSGGGVSIDGATDIATETTLRAIFDVLTGSDEAAGAELDRRKADAAARADEWRRTHPTPQHSSNTRTKKTSGDAVSNTAKKSDKTTDTTVSQRKSSVEIRKENLAKLNTEGQRLYDDIPKSIRSFVDSLKTKTVEELKTEMTSLAGQLSKDDLSVEEQLAAKSKLGELASAYRRKRREEINPDKKLKSAEVNATISEELDKIITSKDLIITSKTNLANILSQMAEYGVGGSGVLKAPTGRQKGILDDQVALSGAIASGIETATGATRPLIAVDESDYKNKMAYVDAVRKGYDAQNYAFAERAYYRKGKRSEQKVGYYGAVAQPAYWQDEGIHSHPTNNAYSHADIKGIMQTRHYNKNYNVDRLITPDFVYELKGLANAPIEALYALSEQFEIIDSIGIPSQIEEIVTNSALYHFAQQNGVQYFKGQAVGNGEYADVTMSTVVSQETLDNLLKYIKYGAQAVQIRKKIVALEKKTAGSRDLSDLNSYIDMAVLERYKQEYGRDVALKQQYINAAKQNPIVANAFKYSNQNKDAMRDEFEMEKMRASSANLIQAALSQGWDMKLLYPQLEDYIESVEFFNGKTSSDSLLGKIKASLVTAKDSSVMNEIVSLLKQYFGDTKLDYIDDAYLDDFLDLADSDPTGKIARDLERLRIDANVSKAPKKKSVVDDDAPEDGVTRAELEEIKKQVLDSIPSIIADLVKNGMSQEEAAEKAMEEAGKRMQNMVAKAVAAEEPKKRGRPKKAKVEAQVEVKPEESKKAVEEAAKTGEKPKVEVIPTVSDGNIQNILSGITDKTKGTANSFEGLIGKFKDVPTAQKILQELRDLMVQVPSATGDAKDGLIAQTTEKANELVEKLVGLKKNRLLDLSNFFGKDVQSDSTHLLGVMKQIFEFAQKTRAEKDAQKATEKSITQENKIQKQEQTESKSKKATDKGGSGYNAFKDGAKVYSREIAQEATLQKILAKLNAGITTKGGSNSVGGNSTNSSKHTPQQKSYATNKFTRAAETQRFNIIGATSDIESNKSILDSKDIAIVAEYNQQYAELFKMQEEFNKTSSTDDEIAIKNLRTKSAIVKELGKEVLATARKTQQLNDAVEQSGTFTDKHGDRKLLGGWSEKLTVEEQNNIPAQLRKFAQEMYGADLAAVKVNKTTGKLTGTLRLNNYQVQDIAVQYDKGTKMMAAFADKERDSLSGLPGFMHGLAEKNKAIIQYLASMTSIYRIVGMVRQGITYIKEIDMALTELRKVTDETDETYAKFLKTASKTGSVLGSTIVEVTQATATFAKLGYSMEMASEMAQAALVYKNVGDGIASADDAADSIISTLKGFKLEATEAMRVVDRFNEIGNNFAITSQGIGEALRLSASALSEGGNSIDESIALITAANEVVQDPSSVGTALKTLTLRLRGAKTELEDASLDVENMAKTTSSLQKKLLGLTGGRVDIMLDNQTFKSTAQILREMASAWEYMTDVQRASALELMGGKRQANTLSAIIQNFDTVESVIKASENSAGSALEENEKYLDSFDGRIKQFTTAVQTKWNEALDTELIKDAIQLVTKLVNLLDFSDSGLVDIVHGLVEGLSWLADVLGNGNLGYTLIAFFGGNLMKKYGLFENLKKTGEETIESLTADISKLDTEISNLTEKANRQSGRAQQKTKTDIEIKEKLREQKKTRLEEMKLSKQEQEEIAESFDVATIKRRNSAYNMNIKKRTAKLEAEGMTPEQIKTDPKIQQWTQQVEKGQQTIDQYNQKIKETDVSMQDVNATTDKSSGKTTVNTATKTVNSNVTQANGDAHQQAGHKTDAHTQDINENTDALNANTGAEVTNQVQTQKSGGFWSKAGAGLKEFGKSAIKTMAYMAILQGAMQILDGIVEGISWAWNKIFPKEKSFEELQEEFTTLNSDLAESKSKLNNLESELDNVNSQIREIRALGSLSFTKQEELDNLQKQSNELERQIEMQKILTKNQQGKTNDAALAAAKAYMQQSAETEDTLDEAVAQGKETGKKWGSFVDGLLMVGGAVLALTGVGTGAGVAMMAAGMVGVGSKAGEAIGGAASEAEYKKQETNQQAIDNYTKKRKEYQDKMDAAFASGNAEEYSKIQEEYAKYESMMADNIGALLEYTSSTDYDTLTTAKKQQYEAYQRMINMYMKANGGSLTDITDSIFDYTRYEKAGYEIKQIQKQLKNGDIGAESAKQQITDIINQTSGLEAEFTALGYKVEDVANAYVQLGEAMADDLSLMDSLDKITSVTDAFDELGNAVKEFKEEGIVSAGTLASLNEKFGNLDEFEELYKVLATGEGDLESAITGVANAYVGQAQIMSNMTDEELDIMVSRLKALGVLNAEEVLMARQKGQQQIDALGLAYSIDLSNYGTAEQAKVAMATAAGLNIADIADDEIKYLAKEYEVDLTNYATKEEQKIAIARARAKAEADIDRANAKKEYESGEITYAEYQARLTDIENSLNFDATYNTISSILNAAYKDFQFNLSGNKIGIGSEFKDLVENQAAKDAFQEAMDYWENRISANQAKYDQIQNEIDLIEKKGGKAGKEYYEEQMRLENERLWLLKQQKAEAQEYLGKFDEDSDGWFIKISPLIRKLISVAL